LKFITVSALALTAASVAIASAAGAPARPAAAAGGLSITPTLIEHAASKGSADNVTVTNRSTQKLDVTVATRPWHQARDGAVAAKRGSTLRGFDISDTSFTLAPGAKQVVTVTTTTAKERYGALEVIGLPRDADTRKGLVVGYRLIASLRLDPAAPVFRFQTSSVKLSGKTLVLPVTSHGNTVQPVSGDVSFKGALGTRSATIHSMRVLPGHTVELPLIAASKLPAGAYKAKIVLKQGNQRGTVTRNVRVKR
jgi:P pilus assembly chaperone PapD